MHGKGADCGDPPFNHSDGTNWTQTRSKAAATLQIEPVKPTPMNSERAATSNPSTIERGRRQPGHEADFLAQMTEQ